MLQREEKLGEFESWNRDMTIMKSPSDQTSTKLAQKRGKYARCPLSFHANGLVVVDDPPEFAFDLDFENQRLALPS